MRTRLLPFHLFQMPQQTMFPLLSGLFPKDMPAALNRPTFATPVSVSVGRFSPFRVGLKTPISVNLKSPMHHVCY